MNDNSVEGKEKPWMYFVFFITGVLSFPLGLFSGVLLSEYLISLQNILCELSVCGLDLPAFSQFLLPLMVCSILLAVSLYVFKVRSFTFALKVFAGSFITSSLILYSSIFFCHL